MATFRKRRSKSGITYTATVRRVGQKTACATFDTKLAAELWAAKTEAAFAHGHGIAPPKITFGEMLDQVLPAMTNPVTASFDYWREAFGNRRLRDVTPQLIAHHRDLLLGAPCRGHNHKTERERSTATVRNYLVELSRAYKLAMSAELGPLCYDNPVRGVKKPAPSRKIVRCLSDDERDALLAACKASDSPDLYPFVLFALTTGARKGEVSALTWDRVDLDARWAWIDDGETKNEDAKGIALTQPVVDLLRARARTDDRVFPVDITKAWHTAVAKAGVKNFRFHDLRHTCASWMVKANVELAKVGKILGHRSPQSTWRYAHIDNDGARAVVDAVMGSVA